MARFFSRRAAALTLAVGSVAAAVAVWASPAGAVDGRVPDSRAVSAAGEITAQYWHGLNRDPDPGGLANYMSFANQNCRWGVLDGSFKILNSAEAHNTWHNDPQALAGMLYAGLLNRPPDAGGLGVYATAIRERGLPWATAQMLGSAEYRSRFGRVCTNPNETATEYDWQTAQAVARNVFVQNAENLGVVCGLNAATRSALGALKSVPYPPVMAVGRIATVANMVITGYGLDGTCGAIVAYLRAAREVNVTINSGAGYNPVFIQWTVGGRKWNGQRPFTIRVGPNPTHWSAYSGAAW